MQYVHRSDVKRTVQVLLDIGAGQGLFSLAAAARGHRAVAFELSAKSVASMEASLAFNGYQDLVTLHQVSCCKFRHMGQIAIYCSNFLRPLAWDIRVLPRCSKSPAL